MKLIYYNAGEDYYICPTGQERNVKILREKAGEEISQNIPAIGQRSTQDAHCVDSVLKPKVARFVK